MDTLMYGMFAFLLCAVGARIISERALRKLPGEQKLLLLDSFSGSRMYGLLTGVVVVAAVFLLPKAFPEDPRTGLYIGLALFVVWVVVRQVMTARRFQALNVDPDYKRSVMFAQVLANVGMVLLVASVIFSTMGLGHHEQP